jgi:uncharacterized protein
MKASRVSLVNWPAGTSFELWVTVDLTGVAHRFRAGHRLRVQISSGAHPRFVRNTGSGEPLATAATLYSADVEICHASQIVLLRDVLG